MTVSVVTGRTEEGDRRREARKRARHAERRHFIMRAARQLLVTEGIEHFTVARVAKSARVSKPGVYYYFDSKEDLVYALAIEVQEEETRQLSDAVGEERRAVDAVITLVRRRVDYYLDDRDSSRILHVWARMLGLESRLETSPAWHRASELRQGLTRRLLEELGRERVPPRLALERIVDLAVALSQGIIATAALDASPLDARARTDALCDDACSWLLDALIGSGRG